MPIHQLGPIQYDQWEGHPKLIGKQFTESVRAGVNGIAHGLAGSWEQPFDVVTTIVHPFFVDAFTQQYAQRELLGSVMGVIYNNINFTSEYSHVYRALRAEVVGIKSLLHFRSLDKNYRRGVDGMTPTELVTRWTLSPIYLGD